MNVQPCLFGEGWMPVVDGNDTARALFERHYSAEKNLARRHERRTKLIVGPGFKLVLITHDASALCVWRKGCYRADGQVGVNCAVYRREFGEMASDLLLDAMRIAWARWPGERLFTFIDPLNVKPTWRAGRPTWGHCFYQAGWKFAGITKGRLHILEVLP